MISYMLTAWFWWRWQTVSSYSYYSIPEGFYEYIILPEDWLYEYSNMVMNN